MFRKSWVVIVSSVLLSHSLVWASTEEQSVYDVLATDLRGQSGCYEINALNARREFLPDYGCEQTVGYLERQCARGVDAQHIQQQEVGGLRTLESVSTPSILIS